MPGIGEEITQKELDEKEKELKKPAKFEAAPTKPAASIPTFGNKGGDFKKFSSEP